MRRLCDEIWILDLGGEGRGSRKSDNVFAIRTPVAIAVAVRYGEAREMEPAAVHYARIEGTRDDKLAALDAITGLTSVDWEGCPDDWQAPFRPAGVGDYFDLPLLSGLMPWQRPGVKAGRTWVISPEEETLRKRWHTLLRAEKRRRRKLFKDSPTGRKTHEAATQLPPSETRLKPVAELVEGSPPPDVVRFAYRSFDRQFVFPDARVIDRPGPDFWRAHGERQIYLATILTQAISDGPGLTACAFIPEHDHFSGRAGSAIPLYRTADAKEANVLPGLLDLLGAAYERKVTPEDFLAYVYGALAQPAFTARYAKELESRELRVPITKDAALFEALRSAGARLLYLHTYGERFVPADEGRGRFPRGAAKCVKAVPGDPDGYPHSFDYNDGTQTLHVGEGAFEPVAPEVFEFEVSGLKVVRSWLKYRMKKGAGRKSSPLDDIRPERWTGQFTTELLELLLGAGGDASGLFGTGEAPGRRHLRSLLRGRRTARCARRDAKATGAAAPAVRSAEGSRTCRARSPALSRSRLSKRGFPAPWFGELG